MSLEVGAGIKRQAEEGFLLRLGAKKVFWSSIQCQERREAYSFVVKGAFPGDVRGKNV